MEKDYLLIYTEEMKRLLWCKSAMDMTRNLAVLILFGMILIMFGFIEPTSHRVPYFGSLAVFALVIFETRLFRHFAVNEYRVQLLERNFVAPTLDNDMKPDKNWEKLLAESYDFPMKPNFLESIAFRIYKNYFILFLALDTSWLAKIYLYPQPAASFHEFVHRLDLGFFLGIYTLIFMTVFWLLFVYAMFWVNKKRKEKSYFLSY
jgi:uncharacterized membrane protein